MTRVRVVLILAILVAGGAYLAGLWPERQRLAEAQSRLEALQEQVSESEARVRLGEILGRLLSLSDAVEAQNYGEAAARASAYFDQVAEEAEAATAPAVRQVLESVQKTRDGVTASLARAEPAVRDILRQQQVAIRRALGYDAAE